MSQIDTKRNVDLVAAEVVVGNIRRLLKKAGKTEDDLLKSHPHPAYLRHILKKHTNAGRKAIEDIVKIFHSWGCGWVIADQITIQDPTAIEVMDHLFPVFDVVAGEPIDFTDMGYPVGESDKKEYADSRDPNGFWVIAHGDSMIGAGIMPGSKVFVEPNAPVESGNTVFARYSGGVVIKKFTKQQSRIILESANLNYRPIIIDNPEELKTIRIYRVTKILSST